MDEGRDPAAFRLHAGACYFKLCEPSGFEPLSTSLVPGMYLPLEYWEWLSATDSLRGPRGGLGLSYESVGRHLNNTLFVQLVQDGWIGSRGVTTETIEATVRSTLEAGRAAVFVDRRTERPTRRTRR